MEERDSEESEGTWRGPSKVETPGEEDPRGLLPEKWLCGSPSLGRQGPHGVGVRMVEESSLREAGTRQGMPLCAL